MGTSDIVSSLLLLALSAVLFAATFSFPKLTVALSPTVFPRFVTAGLFILSTLLLIQGLRRALVRQGSTAQPKASGSAPKGLFVLRFLLLGADALLYAMLLEPAGYLLSTPPFLVAAMLLFGERKWHRLLAVPVLSTVILYALFRMVFRVPLPRSVLW
jgi:uncharacterized membrane protein